MTARTQLVVLYNDDRHMYFPVGPDRGWRVDSASRCLVVGKFPRTYIPLDTVRSFDIEAIGGDAPGAVDEFDEPAGPLESLRATVMREISTARDGCAQARGRGDSPSAEGFFARANALDWVLQRIDEEAAR